MNEHECLEIEFETGVEIKLDNYLEWVLFIDEKPVISIDFCPFCGDNLNE